MELGIKCPYCKEVNNHVVWCTKKRKSNGYRRRECRSCGRKFWTHEEVYEKDMA